MPTSRLLLACLAVAACSGQSDEIDLRTDPSQLAESSARGDSIYAALAQGGTLADTIARIAAGEMNPTAVAAPPEEFAVSYDTTPIALTSEQPVDRNARAKARGDSMAREDARRMVAAMAPSESRARGDTLRGVVVTHGAAAAPQIALETPVSAGPVVLSGMAIADLTKLTGVEVVVRGVRVSPRDLAVTSYAVRAVDGVPAIDGVLALDDGGQWVLQQSEGTRRRLAAVPAELRGQSGARVWISVGDGTPRFGVISRPR